MIRRSVLAALVVASLGLVFADTANAGGTNSLGQKKSVTMKVFGGQAAGKPAIQTLFVPSGAAAPQGNQAASYYTNLGAKYVGPGQTVSFLVAPGTGTAYVVPNTNQVWGFGPAQSTPYSAVNGNVGYSVVSLIDGDPANPLILPRGAVN